MAYKLTPTRERLRHLFDYDPDTGFLTRRVASPRCPAGEILTHTDPNKYFSVSVDGENFPAHRLIWKYVTGQEPVVIDHIDGDKSNNRLMNLRDVDHCKNSWNRTRRTSIESGFTGVVRAAGGRKWRAVVKSPEGVIFIGPFSTPNAASQARDQLLLLYRGPHHRLPKETT